MSPDLLAVASFFTGSTVQLTKEQVKLLRQILMKFAKSICAEISDEDLKDIVQEALYELLALRGKGKIHDFLKSAFYAVRHAVDTVLKDQGRKRETPKEQLEVGETNREHVHNQVEKQETSKELQEAMQRLNERERTILYRRYFLQESLKDIAKFLGVPAENIYEYHKRALHHLRKHLEQVYTKI